MWMSGAHGRTRSRPVTRSALSRKQTRSSEQRVRAVCSASFFTHYCVKFIESRSMSPAESSRAAHGHRNEFVPRGSGHERWPRPGRDRDLTRAFHESSGLRGGAGRDRTGDLLNAIQALSQLSYGPTQNAQANAPDGVLSKGSFQSAGPRKTARAWGMLGFPAGVAKLVYAGDSKSPGRKAVRVRIPPPAPGKSADCGAQVLHAAAGCCAPSKLGLQR